MTTTSIVPFSRYSIAYTGEIPHLSTQESTLWRLFVLSDPAKKYKGFDFDVKVGSYAAAAIANPTPENMLQLGTFAKRIDAIGFVQDELVDLFEIKPERLTNAIGQLLLYKDLFLRTYIRLRVRNLICITSREDTEVEDFALSHGVTVITIQTQKQEAIL
jgi:hypothetical protein